MSVVHVRAASTCSHGVKATSGPECFFLGEQRNEEKYVTGQKLGHLLAVHVAAGCGIERRRPMQLRSHHQLAKKKLVEGDPLVHAVGVRAAGPHVGTPVMDVAARDDQLGDHVGRVHGGDQRTKTGRLEPAWRSRCRATWTASSGAGVCGEHSRVAGA